MLTQIGLSLSSNPWVLIAFSYLLGAIPTSLIISKVKGVDLRSQGSRNLGATNVYRVMGIKYAIVVFVIDLLKGAIPTYIAWASIANPVWHIGVGVTTIIGHSLSVWIRFKGGKGAATGLGVLLVLVPGLFGIAAVIAVAIIWKWRIVSVATIVNCILIAVLVWLGVYPLAYKVFISAICIFIVIRHRGNISRLIHGQENKV
ncbi:glycerol-3-phosphate 1-O-acyltransferase PlsY [bacterium]|jgi:acyl phosphate:glycerol-3-phosphate acyltransferase|nr:glycerol-3-phosphate 1-O-acyltransferase PlsY [bacterium]